MSQRNIDDDYELDHYIETIENWRPVIESAKALVEAEAMDFDGGEPLTSAEQALVTAVEALQEVEGG